MRRFSDLESLAAFFRNESAKYLTRSGNCSRRDDCGMCSFNAQTLERAARSCEEPDNRELRPAMFSALGLLDVIFVPPVSKRSETSRQETRELVEA